MPAWWVLPTASGSILAYAEGCTRIGAPAMHARAPM